MRDPLSSISTADLKVASRGSYVPSVLPGANLKGGFPLNCWSFGWDFTEISIVFLPKSLFPTGVIALSWGSSELSEVFFGTGWDSMGLSDGDKVLAGYSDLELVRMSVDDKEAPAFEELMSRYYQRTYAVIFRMVRDQEFAADLTQSTFLKAWRGLASYSGNAAFFTWIYRIARNLVSSEYRKQQSRPQVVMAVSGGEGSEDQMVVDPESKAIGPDESSLRNERRQEILAAVDDLVPDFREIIVLRDFEKMPYEDIAELLEMPVGTVRSRLHRARLELKAKLSHLFD